MNDSTIGLDGDAVGTLPLKALDADRWLDDPARRQAYVTRMFEIIAPRYDHFTRAFSFGMDARWKRELVTIAHQLLGPAEAVLDLACGTGDLALAIAPAVARGRVVGIDAAAGMIERADAARRARGCEHVHFRVGDMADLRFVPTGSIDLVTIGYGLRNVADLDACLGECRRVLRRGGTLLSLDFALPEGRLWRALFLSYLQLAGDVVGWLWHRDPTVYGYIARSIRRFMTAAQLSRRLQQHGFEVREERHHLGGGVCLHVAWRYS
ncbi:MAG TPA: ubiquinone/menaquinone biosynthesis methyltransferase [Planctomycetota bacterium]|nr:ubiquinone/menaquinone biosynthesis methyltransferase [Planctomycetota bacterium]